MRNKDFRQGMFPGQHRELPMCQWFWLPLSALHYVGEVLNVEYNERDLKYTVCTKGASNISKTPFFYIYNLSSYIKVICWETRGKHHCLGRCSVDFSILSHVVVKITKGSMNIEEDNRGGNMTLMVVPFFCVCQYPDSFAIILFQFL